MAYDIVDILQTHDIPQLESSCVPMIFFSSFQYTELISVGSVMPVDYDAILLDKSDLNPENS